MLIILRKIQDLVMKICFPCGFFNFTEIRMHIPVADVVFNASLEDMVFLQHKSKVVPQEGIVEIIKIHPVQQDFPGIRKVKLAQQVDHRRLPGSAQSYKRCSLAVFKGHGNFIQGFGTVGIRKAYLFKLKIPFDAVFCKIAVGFLFIVGIQDIEIAFGIDHGIVHIVINAVKLPDRCGNIIEQHNVQHNGTDGHLLVEHQIYRKKDDQYHPELFDESLQPVVNEVGFPGKQLAFHQLHLQVVLFFALEFLAHEAFDDHNGINQIQQSRSLLFALVPQRPSHTAQLFGLQGTDIKINRDNNGGNQAYIDVLKVHNHQCDQ